MGHALAGARSAARRTGLPAAIPPPGVPAMATRPATRAVAARAMAPWAGPLFIRAMPAGAGIRAVALRPGTSPRPAALARADRAPGGRGRLLLGFLLGAALARAVDAPAYPDQRAEGLLVVGAALVDVVLGHAQDAGGSQLLQRGLPVQAGPEPGRLGYHGIEQPVHERARLGQASLDVDGADDRLEGVGQDRGLVAPARAFLAPAQP